MSVEIHSEAEHEFLDAVRYYQALQPELGAEFDEAVANAVADIEWSPEAWPRFPGWERIPIVRSRRVAVFPYRVLYFADAGRIVIIAIAHQRRSPGLWADRVRA